MPHSFHLASVQNISIKNLKVTEMGRLLPYADRRFGGAAAGRGSASAKLSITQTPRTLAGGEVRRQVTEFKGDHILILDKKEL
jgi:hypothetical protein